MVTELHYLVAQVATCSHVTKMYLDLPSVISKVNCFMCACCPTSIGPFIGWMVKKMETLYLLTLFTSVHP